ncbi:MAG: SRPBCC family protein [Actinobacteria bacterium]|nr:SRPBCC family protein [Actinomycetota bacterium]
MSDPTTFRCASRLEIDRGAPEVFDYLCDVGRWPEWAPTVERGWIAGGGPPVPGARVEQRAKLILGRTRHRVQRVTVVEAPHRLAFAGPLGTSTARWGMELTPTEAGRSEAEMWIEVDLRNIMRLLPRRPFRQRIQRVMDVEMVAIKAAVEERT